MGIYQAATYHAGGFLIEALRQTGHLATMLHDGSDIILFETPQRQKVSIHLIDSSIELYEIRKTLDANTAQGIYTLFMLWGTMMIPPQGKVFRMTEWMEAFLALNDGCVYTYDVFDGETYIFPVYFPGAGDLRLAEYGLTVRFSQLTCRVRETHLPGFAQPWRMADFLGAAGDVAADRADQAARAGESGSETPYSEPVTVADLAWYFSVLGVSPDDDLETVRLAYRARARQLHPDTNPAPDATEQMQQLNEAYSRVLERFGGG